MRVRLAAIALLLAGCGVMQGCNTTPVGQGPIRFGPKLQASYDEYLQRVGPGAFVIGKRGAYYSYCPETGCVPGLVSLAMQLCHRHDDTDCRLYAVGTQVVWRRDLPAPAEADPVAVDTTVSADLQAERQRNAAKVDCARQLKGTLSAELQAQLAAALAVKESRGPWTFCDLMVDGVASGKVTEESMAELRQGPVDAAMLNRLVGLVRPAAGTPKRIAS